MLGGGGGVQVKSRMLVDGGGGTSAYNVKNAWEETLLSVGNHMWPVCWIVSLGL